MRLKKITDHVYYYSFDPGLDRPCLGYIKGDSFSLAVDAGHSSRHVDDFYKALKEERLPLPDLTVLTYWHWDHTFGMHRIYGKTLASDKTDRDNEVKNINWRKLWICQNTMESMSV